MNNSSSKPFAIDFVTPNRTYYVAAKSQEEQLAWIDLFRRFTKVAIDGVVLANTVAANGGNNATPPPSSALVPSNASPPNSSGDARSSAHSSGRTSASSNDRASSGSGQHSEKLEDKESGRPAIARVMSVWNLVKSNVERGVLFIQDPMTLQYTRKVVEVRGDNLFLYSSEAKVSQRRASSSSIVLTMCQVRPGRLPEQEDAAVPGTTDDAIFRVFSLVTPITTLYFMAQTVPEASRWIRIFQQIQKVTRERARADTVLSMQQGDANNSSAAPGAHSAAPTSPNTRPGFIITQPSKASTPGAPNGALTNSQSSEQTSHTLNTSGSASSRPNSAVSVESESSSTSATQPNRISPRAAPADSNRLSSNNSSGSTTWAAPTRSLPPTPNNPLATSNGSANAAGHVLSTSDGQNSSSNDIFLRELPTIGVEALDINTRRVLEILNRPENRFCADCRDEEPLWASINLGIFICLECSGIHRSLGVHISKVRSVDLDRWDEPMAAAMAEMGNEASNAVYEAELPANRAPNAHTSRAEKEWFIRAKYSFKQFCAGGAGDAAARSAMTNVRASAALASMVYQEGHLSVSSESEKSWKTRWVVLKENRLLFFKARADPEPRTSLLLSCAHVKTTTLDRINTFELVVPGDVFYLQAENSSDFFLWMDLIRTSQKLFKSSQAPVASLALPVTSTGDTDRTSPRSPASPAAPLSPTSGAVPVSPGSISAPSAIQEVYRTGWLYKQGDKVKNWKKRWFVLKDNKLTYYAAKNDKTPKGSIALSLAVPKDGQHEAGTSIKGLSDHSYSYTFEIVVTGRVYYIAATSDIETQEWINDIRASKKAHESRVALSMATAKNKELALSSPGKALDALPSLDKED